MGLFRSDVNYVPGFPTWMAANSIPSATLLPERVGGRGWREQEAKREDRGRQMILACGK